MADVQATVFISHSSKDREFALELQASLEARDIRTWLDLRNLEGGEDFDKKIEAVIKRSTSMLVILSPDAVESRWVRSEIHFAFDHNVPIIPLMRRKTYPPVPINTLNYIECLNNNVEEFERALQAIQVRIYKLVANSLPLITPHAPPVSPNFTVPIDVPQTDSTPNTVAIPTAPALPPPDPYLNSLYLAGLEAAQGGDLERARMFWQEILDHKPTFRSGQVLDEMSDLRLRLQERRVSNAQALARKASEERRWQQAASMWNEVLKYEPNNELAREQLLYAIQEHALGSHEIGNWDAALGSWRLLLQKDPQNNLAADYEPIAEVNRLNAHLYDDAMLFVEQSKPDLASAQLAKLWQKAPYFGDPRGVAKSLGISVPPTLAQVKEEAARKSEAKRIEQEKQVHDALERAIAEQQRREEERIARQRVALDYLQEQERLKEESLRVKTASIEERNRYLRERDTVRENLYAMLIRIEEHEKQRRSDYLSRAFVMYICVSLVPVFEIIGALAALIILVMRHHNVFGTAAIFTGVLGAAVTLIGILAMNQRARRDRTALRRMVLEKQSFMESMSALDKQIRAVDETIGDGRNTEEETFEEWKARKKRESRLARRQQIRSELRRFPFHLSRRS